MATDSAASRGSPLGLEGALFDGRFRIEERIAEGGFAVVYRAWQVALDRRVALKVLKAPRSRDEHSRGEFRERFASEAKTIAKLRHLHIVDVYDFSVATLPSGEVAPWMALEWLEGETLAKHLERRRREGQRGREPGEAVDFLRPVLEALAHAHSHGIAHRDIKPSNIMVTETATGSTLRVLDFGIAKIMVDDQAPNTGNTRTESTPAFSPAYAAPEQVAFSRTGPWTDVHALGLVLSEVMTDQAPFSDPDPEAHLFEQVMARGRPTPASKGRDVGPFEPILEKALALSPRDRFRSAGELLSALDHAKANDGMFFAGTADTAPATALGESAPAGVTAKAGRRPSGFWAAGALTAVVVAAGGVGLARTLSSQAPSAAPSSSGEAVPRVAEAAAPIRSAPQVVVPEAAPDPPAPIAVPEPLPESSTRKAPRVSTPKARPRQPASALTAPAPAPPAPPASLGDGRDLFNDTK